MNETLFLKILGVPVPKQSFRIRRGKTKNGKAFAMKYQSKKVVQEENNIRAQIIGQLPEGFKPFTKCVIVEHIVFHFPPPKSLSAKLRKRMEKGFKVYKTSRPDLTDNLMKLIFDAMKGIIYLDDSQIVEIIFAEKTYSETPGIHIGIYEIDQKAQETP